MMPYRALLFPTLLILTLVAAAGCSTGRRGGGGFGPDTGASDTGPADPDGGEEDATVPFDTGTPDTGADSGIVLMDSGTPDTGTPDTGRPDTGTPDTGTPDTGRPDTGTPDTGPACGRDTVDFAVGSYCDISADTCRQGCPSGDTTCFDNCFAAGGPDCTTCLDNNILACVVNSGCQRQWDLWVCCVEANCGASPTSSCVTSVRTGSCRSQSTALNTCDDSIDVNTSCPDWYADCF